LERLSCNTRKRAISTLSGLQLDEPGKSIEHLTQSVALCDHLQNFRFTNVETLDNGSFLCAPDHRFDEPTRLSLSEVASLQSLPLFPLAESL
jgi:hypothetical protein